MNCSNCGREDLLVVHFSTVGDTTFAYCRHCEHRRWQSGSGELDVKAVLDSAASIEPAKPSR